MTVQHATMTMCTKARSKTRVTFHGPQVQVTALLVIDIKGKQFHLDVKHQFG